MILRLIRRFLDWLDDGRDAAWAPTEFHYTGAEPPPPELTAAERARRRP